MYTLWYGPGNVAIRIAYTTDTEVALTYPSHTMAIMVRHE